jgi:hypothetical protein
MIGDYGAFGGIKIGRENRSIRRKPAAVPLCSPKIQHYLTWDRTRAAAVISLSYGTAFWKQLTTVISIMCVHSPRIPVLATSRVHIWIVTLTKQYYLSNLYQVYLHNLHCDSLRIRRPEFDSRQEKLLLFNFVFRFILRSPSLQLKRYQ